MSQSSETNPKEANPPFMLGYEHEAWANTYYTAKVAPGIGVCLCRLIGQWMIQFFPWNDSYQSSTGHTRYVDFITVKAHTMIKEGAALFEHWPYLQTESGNTLILKCVIEDGVKQIGELHATNKRGPVDAATGEVVE